MGLLWLSLWHWCHPVVPYHMLLPAQLLWSGNCLSYRSQLEQSGPQCAIPGLDRICNIPDMSEIFSTTYQIVNGLLKFCLCERKKIKQTSIFWHLCVHTGTLYIFRVLDLKKECERSWTSFNGSRLVEDRIIILPSLFLKLGLIWKNLPTSSCKLKKV
jgi:hypothetical protein